MLSDAATAGGGGGALDGTAAMAVTHDVSATSAQKLVAAERMAAAV